MNNIQQLHSVTDLSRDQINRILTLAKYFLQNPNTDNNKRILSSRTVMNLFFENSTRTRSSFEVAAKSLGADVINFDTETSSTKKGEGLLDTMENLGAMGTDLFVIRHQMSGATQFLARHLKTNASIINAGDGCHEHPSQGLLDLFTIQHYKQPVDGLKIAIVGDILHSRVARSLIHALTIWAAPHICVIGPKTLLPTDIEKFGVTISYDMSTGLQDADVIVILRLQKERMSNVFIPSETEYRYLYGLDAYRLKNAKPNAIIMHPGPINRGIEICSTVADGPQSVILKQVTFGVAVRMAIMTQLFNPEINL